MPAELKAWTFHLQRTILDAAQRLLFSKKARRCAWTHFGPIAFFARNWILDHQFIVYGDKRGHIGLVKFSDLQRCHRDWLAPPRYQELRRAYFTDAWWQAVCASYRKLSQRVVATHKDVTISSLVSSLRRPMSSMFAKIGNTLKTHKKPGAISLRYLHLASTFPLEGLGRWVSQLLDKRLRQFKHVLVDSKRFQTEVTCLVLSPSACILHFDLDDFFNKGSPNFLAQNSSKCLYSSMRSLASDIISFLLRHQYVCSELLPELVWDVLEGAGQGLVMSAAVASSSFLHANELNGPAIARSATLSGYNCLYYRRYVDNLFAIFSDAGSMRRFLQFLRSQLLVYSGKVEDADVDGFDFLDCRYNIVRCGTYARIFSTPILKLEANFLSVYSCHPWALHVAWPIAYIRRVHERCHTTADYHKYKGLFLNTLATQGWPHKLLRHFDQETNYHVPHHLFRGPLLAKRDRQRNFWLVLPFHPMWEGIGKSLRKIVGVVEYHDLLDAAFDRKVCDQIRVSFRVSHVPAVSQNINKELNKNR